jgi:hypothetical protein
VILDPLRRAIGKRVARAMQEGGEAVVAAHPDETVLQTRLFALPGASELARARVVALIAAADGLSFRDLADTEVLRVDSDRILAVEIAPLTSGAAVRPARVTLLDGGHAEFWIGSTPDEMVDAVVAIRTALGRPAG